MPRTSARLGGLLCAAVLTLAHIAVHAAHAVHAAERCMADGAPCIVGDSLGCCGACAHVACTPMIGATPETCRGLCVGAAHVQVVAAQRTGTVRQVDDPAVDSAVCKPFGGQCEASVECCSNMLCSEGACTASLDLMAEQLRKLYAALPPAPNDRFRESAPGSGGVVPLIPSYGKRGFGQPCINRRGQRRPCKQGLVCTRMWVKGKTKAVCKRHGRPIYD